MSRNIRRSAYSAQQLELIPETGREVVLASGGPVMILETIEGDRGLCSWVDDDGEEQRHLFALVTLRRLARITEGDYQELRP